MLWVLLQQNRIRSPFVASLLNSKRMDTGGKGSQIQVSACRHDVILKGRAQVLFQSVCSCPSSNCRVYWPSSAPTGKYRVKCKCFLGRISAGFASLARLESVPRYSLRGRRSSVADVVGDG